MSSLEDKKLNDILEETLNEHFQEQDQEKVKKSECLQEIDQNEEIIGDSEDSDTNEDSESDEKLVTFNNIEDFINSDIKWIFLSGKGGVGKTTCSSAMGIKYSQKLEKENKKVLIVSTDPAHNLSDSFNQKFNEKPLLVDSFTNLYCMEYDNKIGIQKAQKEFMEKMNKNKLQNFNMDQFNEMGSFFQSMPGIDEALGFLSLTKEIKKMDFEVVIFDTAPTGHTSKLLSYPQILKKSYDNMINRPMGQMFKMFMQNSIRNGNDRISEMVQRVDELNEKLCDSNHTTFLCVGIPEFLSVYENERFIHQLFDMNVNVSGIIINQIIEDEQCTNDFWKNRKKMQDKYVKLINDLYQTDFFITYTSLEDEEIRGCTKLRNFSSKLFENKNIMKGPSFNEEELS
jgi:arsenite-transporting ATPase